MGGHHLYPLFPAVRVVCRALDVDLQAVATGAGFPGDTTDFGATLVDAATYFGLWERALSMSTRSDAVVFLGTTMATGPVIPAFFALSSAPTLRIGFARLARYKGLIGPTAIRIEETPRSVTLSFYSEDASVPMPPSFGALHLVFAAERARTLTARPVKPLQATLPILGDRFDGVSESIDTVPRTGDVSSITFAAKDMDMPLVAQDDALWREVEQDLEAQRSALHKYLPMAERTVGALMELLPSGDATIARVAFTLGTSISTMQRRLRNEGKVFKELLRQTREHLATRYLTKTEVNPAEISSLLGYREPNSFYRSFKSWTGVTPSTYRRKSR